MYRILKFVLLLGIIVSCSPKKEPPAYNIPTSFAVSGDKVRLRKIPSDKGEVIALLRKGEPLEILEYDNSYPVTVPGTNGSYAYGIWVKVRVEGKSEGYIFSPYIGTNMGKENSPSYIAVSSGGAQDNFALMGVSSAGVLENHSAYYNGIATFSDSDVKKDLTLFDSTGTEIGALKNPRKAKNQDDCCFEIRLEGTYIPKSPEFSKSKAVIGRTVGSYSPSIPIVIEEDVPESIRKEIWEDTNRRIKSSSFDIPLNFKIATCQTDCKYRRFRTGSGFEYLITEKVGNLGYHPEPDTVEPSPHVYRIDRIESGKLIHLSLMFQFSYQGDTGKTFAVTDLNGDGLPEIWTYWSGYEWWYYTITVLKKDWVIRTYFGGGGGV